MNKKKLRKIAIILFWISVWFLGAKAVDNSILLVPPSRALGELLSMFKNPEFYRTIGHSLLRIGSGFFMGFIVAVMLASLSSRFTLLEEILSPMLTLLKAIPVASFVVLLLIWWGSSLLAVAICFIVVLPNIYTNTLEGLKNTDKQLLQMAQVFHMPIKNRLFYIYRPSLAPFLYSSMKISLGMCWKSGVAAEVIGTPDYSIGEGLYLSKIYLNTAGVFAWTAAVILLSVLFEKLVLWLVHHFFQWEPACARPVNRRNPSGRTRGEGKGELTANHIYKSFGNQQVLSDFCAVYQAGETYVLNGPSGSGKTTLLNVLAGLLQPDSGSVESTGNYSMVFQEDRLCMDYSAVKNVELITGDAMRAEEALGKLLEQSALHKPCRELSGGMKRRVALVRAMEAESDYILLDEPFTGLDSRSRDLAEEYIRERQKGRTVVIVTHI